VSDFNKDGYPDLYIGNDFHEDDYFYINNGNGTFSEKLKEYFGHVSKFSMGNDATRPKPIAALTSESSSQTASDGTVRARSSCSWWIAQ
jgi:hypothetical protein